MLIKNLILGPVQANCYILTDENSGETAVIDPGECTNALIAALKCEEVKELKYILLTHGHFDHIDGVGELKAHFPSAKVAIHTFDEACLIDDMRSLAKIFGLRQKTKLSSDLRLKDGDKLFLGTKEIAVIHTPGHSAGGVTFKTENCMFTGDTLFFRSVGRTDFPDGDAEVLKESIMKLYSFECDFIVYSGHGEKTTLNYEKNNNPYIRE